MERVLSGHASEPIKLAPEIEAEKAAEKAAQKQKQAWGNALKGLTSAGADAPPAPHAEERPPLSKSAARRQRSRERTQKEQEQAAGAAGKTGQQPSSGVSPAGKERFFLSASGEKLPWLEEAEFKRVGKACYYFQFGKCDLTPEQCKEKHGKEHDQLPKKLLGYLREPGQKRGRSGSPARNAEGKSYEEQLNARWATQYCHKFADGKCSKTEEECGRPHLTNEEAKAKAEGKTLGEKFKELGYTPQQKGKGKGRGRGGTAIATPGAFASASPLGSL